MSPLIPKPALISRPSCRLKRYSGRRIDSACRHGYRLHCPGCNEANAFAAGIPRPGDELHCPVCGEIIVVRDEFINEFNTIMEGLGNRSNTSRSSENRVKRISGMDEKTLGGGTVRVPCYDYAGGVMLQPPTALGSSLFTRAADTMRPTTTVFY